VLTSALTSTSTKLHNHNRNKTDGISQAGLLSCVAGSCAN